MIRKKHANIWWKNACYSVEASSQETFGTRRVMTRHLRKYNEFKSLRGKMDHANINLSLFREIPTTL